MEAEELVGQERPATKEFALADAMLRKSIMKDMATSTIEYYKLLIDSGANDGEASHFAGKLQDSMYSNMMWQLNQQGGGRGPYTQENDNQA